MTQPTKAFHVLTLRDCARDTVASARFKRRLDGYREGLQFLASELSLMIHALDGAQTSDGAAPAALRTAIEHTPRERALACEVRSDAAYIASLALALLQDRATAGAAHAQDELAAWEEVLERFAWFDAPDIARCSVCDDADDVESLRQLGQLAARLLADPDAPALPVCPHYLTAQDLAPDALPPDCADAVPCFGFSDTYQFSSFISETVGLNYGPCDRTRATLMRLLAGKSLVVDAADGRRVVLLPRALSDRFNVSVERPWCVENMGWGGAANPSWTRLQVDRLRVLDAFHAASFRPGQYLVGTRELPPQEGDIQLDLAELKVADVPAWYAYQAEEGAPALALVPAGCFWEALKLVANAPSPRGAEVQAMVHAEQLSSAGGCLTVLRRLLVAVGMPADERSLVLIGNADRFELWPADAWREAEEPYIDELEGLLFGDDCTA